jgi:hypothetical protein
MKVAYILNYFPVLSETFIVREILELKKHFNVVVFAKVDTLNHEFSAVIHNDTREILKEVQYFQALLWEYSKIKRWWKILNCHLFFLMKKPVRYLTAFYFSFNKGRSTLLKFVLSALYARKLMNDRIDHIHVHFALQSCTYAMLISMLTDIPYSFTIHAHDIFIEEQSQLLEEKFNRAKFVVSISEYNRQFILDRFETINGNKIKVIHCGLKMSDFEMPARKQKDRFIFYPLADLLNTRGLSIL